MQLLLDRCAGVNVANDDGRTALHFAAWNSHPQAAYVLLSHGADMAQIAHDGSIPPALSQASKCHKLPGRTADRLLCNLPLWLAFVVSLVLRRFPSPSFADSQPPARLFNGEPWLLYTSNQGHMSPFCQVFFNVGETVHRAAGRAVPVIRQRGCRSRRAIGVGWAGLRAADVLCHSTFWWPEELLLGLHRLRLVSTPLHAAAAAGDHRRVVALAAGGVDVNCQASSLWCNVRQNSKTSLWFLLRQADDGSATDGVQTPRGLEFSYTYSSLNPKP